MDENNVQGNYGLVKVIKGKYKNRFVYYDDDDADGNYNKKAVIYFGDFLSNAEYTLVPYNYLISDYTFKDLKQRSGEINLLLWSKEYTSDERLALIEEKGMIDKEILSRLEFYIEDNKNFNNRIFLSHSSYDKSIVVSIAMDLKEKGFNPWIDCFDILPGESIIEKINQGLDDAEFLLLFLSKNSVRSNWVLKEWETMLWDEIYNNKIKIIPIKLDDCEVPKILKTKKYIDFSNDYNTGFYEIVNTIKQYLERSSTD